MALRVLQGQLMTTGKDDNKQEKMTISLRRLINYLLIENILSRPLMSMKRNTSKMSRMQKNTRKSLKTQKFKHVQQS